RCDSRWCKRLVGGENFTLHRDGAVCCFACGTSRDKTISAPLRTLVRLRSLPGADAVVHLVTARRSVFAFAQSHPRRGAGRRAAHGGVVGSMARGRAAWVARASGNRVVLAAPV